MNELASLQRDHTCVQNMNWRCDVPPGAVDRLLAALLAAGFVRQPGPDALPALLSPDHHRVLVVRRTGRVQLRIDYVIPPHERRHAAEALFALIVRRLAETPG